MSDVLHAAPRGLLRGVELAPFTTLKLGGPAEYFARITSTQEAQQALAWALQQGIAASVLGCGSNLVVSDTGCAGLVLQMASRGIALEHVGDAVRLTAQAGEPWENVVQCALSENLAGLECLTGIPGSVGATPIQNVGAYGQEVGTHIEAVEVLDRSTHETRWLSREACGFAYRDSFFKRFPERYLVLAVRFVLEKSAAPSVRYPELQRALSARGLTEPSLHEVARAVRALRAGKSMIVAAEDPHSQSAGSFFMNPIVSSEQAEQVRAKALALGVVARVEDVPCFDAGAGNKKLAAAWLIEKSGIPKGMRQGAVGVSAHHTLALVHYGGGTTAALLALAEGIKARVYNTFQVELKREPTFWGA